MGQPKQHVNILINHISCAIVSMVLLVITIILKSLHGTNLDPLDCMLSYSQIKKK
jgi:hypothetical protein